ncbi:BatD family protein [Plesiomonas shigelloides]|uniref:BatD family protein n=1 Tax=Plesiomonas shigelloides TaxID=703 RepID=UPI00387F0C45
MRVISLDSDIVTIMLMVRDTLRSITLWKTGIALLCLSLSPLAQALTKLDISIDKEPVEQGQPFTLTITADDLLPNEALDLSPLFGQSFVVGNTEYNQIPADKKQPAATRWKTTLMQDQTGNYQIPALTIDNIASQPLAFNVVPAKVEEKKEEVPAEPAKPVITLDQAVLNTRLSKPVAYPDEAVYLDIDLELASELLDGVLSTPELSNGTLRQVGQDRSWSLMRDGNRYQIVSRRYQIMAHEPGNITISNIRFRGTVRGSSQLQPPLNAYAEAMPVTLNVRPLPKDLAANWLPAEKVSLEETWFPQPTAAKVGEPLTRTIRLRARGLGDKPLVMPEIVYPAELSLHAQPVEQRRTVNGETELEIRHILMPKRTANNVMLPEISLTWWNTQTEKAETAVLAAQPLVISSNPALSQPVVPMVKPKENYANLFGYIAIFGGFLLAGGLYWHFSQKRSLRNELSRLSLMMPSEPEPEEKAWLELEQALNSHEPAQITRALSQWARQRWPGRKFTHFAELPSGDAIDRELTRLRRSKDNKSSWNPQTLRQLLHRIRGIRSYNSNSAPAVSTPGTDLRRDDDFPKISLKLDDKD